MVARCRSRRRVLLRLAKPPSSRCAPPNPKTTLKCLHLARSKPQHVCQIPFGVKHASEASLLLSYCSAFTCYSGIVATGADDLGHGRLEPRRSARHVFCGHIAGSHTAYSSRGKPTFINLDRPYPNQIFTVLVWGSDRENAGAIPVSGQLCVNGTSQTESYLAITNVILTAPSNRIR